MGDQELAHARAVHEQRVRGEVQRAAGEVVDAAGFLDRRAGRPAGDVARQRHRAVGELPRGVAVADGEEPLVLRDAAQHGLEPLLARGRAEVGGHRLREWLLHGVGHELRAHVEVAHEPAQGEIVDQRRHAVGDGAEGDDERDDEAQGETHDPGIRLARLAWASDGRDVARGEPPRALAGV